MPQFFVSLLFYFFYINAAHAQLFPFSVFNKTTVSGPPPSLTYSKTTPGTDTWVSTCANGVAITVYGGGGGGGGSINTTQAATGGVGGNASVLSANFSSAYIPLGTTISVTVGSGGAGGVGRGVCSAASGGTGGGGNGGIATSDSSCGGQGGGTTYVSSTYLGSPAFWLIAAGGGGGGGGHLAAMTGSPGGAGGHGGNQAPAPLYNSTSYCTTGTSGGWLTGGVGADGTGMSGAGGGGSGNFGGKGGRAGCYAWQTSGYYGAWGGDGGSSTYHVAAAQSPAVSVSTSDTYGKGGQVGSGVYLDGGSGLGGKIEISCL